MTNFEHVLKTIDPEVLKDILAENLAVDKETGEARNCGIRCNEDCEKCIFSDGDGRLTCIGISGAREWLDQEYTGPETEEAVTSRDISW